MPSHPDVVVIGAGAAGLMCALTAGYAGRRVLVLDHASKPGKKILMSGGGRCNFTNLDTAPANFFSANPHFCISALKRYRPEHFLELVERHAIEPVEKGPGQLFCADSSRPILDMLLTECDWAGVAIRLATPIERVERHAEGMRLSTAAGRYERTVHLYRPPSASVLQQFTSWLAGTPAEFTDPKFPARGDGREVTGVKSAGTAKVTLNLLTKDMGTFGYSEDVGDAGAAKTTRAW